MALTHIYIQFIAQIRLITLPGYYLCLTNSLIEPLNPGDTT